MRWETRSASRWWRCRARRTAAPVFPTTSCGSSWTAHQGGRDMVLYTTAKTALAGFTRAQALEWAPYDVHVNAIAPGIFPDVVTSGEERVRQSTQRAEQTVPLRRPGRLREVGLLALYLASAASDYMTGQTIPLDGGLSL